MSSSSPNQPKNSSHCCKLSSRTPNHSTQSYSRTTSPPRYTTRSDPFADELFAPFPEFLAPSSDHSVSPFDQIDIMSAIIGTISNLFHKSMRSQDPDSYAALEKHSNLEDVEALNRRSEDAASSSDADTLRDVALVEREPQSGFRVDARFISDVIIGLSDGLTVPFALTAGLSGLGDTKVVILGGFAELIAGAISMGLGGYLAAKSEEESYRSLAASTRTTIKLDPSSIRESIASVFTPYNMPSSAVEQITSHLSNSDPTLLADFLLRFQHEQAEPPASRAIICAITIASGYFIGGMIPLLPYFFFNDVMTALWGSVGAMCFALFVFGYSKTCYNCGWRGAKNAWKGTKGGLQMVVIGCVAAGCAMGLVRAFKGFTE